MSAEEIKASGRRFFEDMNKGKVAALAAMDDRYTTDVVVHSSSGEDIRGLKNYKRIWSKFFDAIPDAQFTIDDLVVEGDRVAARVTFIGTHKGKYLGIPPTNKKVTNWEIAIARIAGGKVVEEWARADTLGLMQQLCIVPSQRKENNLIKV